MGFEFLVPPSLHVRHPFQAGGHRICKLEVGEVFNSNCKPLLLRVHCEEGRDGHGRVSSVGSVRADHGGTTTTGATLSRWYPCSVLMMLCTIFTLYLHYAYTVLNLFYTVLALFLHKFFSVGRRA